MQRELLLQIDLRYFVVEFYWSNNDALEGWMVVFWLPIGRASPLNPITRKRENFSIRVIGVKIKVMSIKEDFIAHAQLMVGARFTGTLWCFVFILSAEERQI